MLLDLWPWRASSGMRRLWAYQFQEEVLQKDKEKKDAETTEHQRRVAAPETVRVEGSTRKKRTLPESRAIAEAAREKLELPPFRRKPISLQPSPIDVLPELMWLLRGELQTKIVALYPAFTKLSKPVEAANDADIRLRLLLLAA